VVRLIERALNEGPPEVRAVRRDIPRPLDRIVQQCLAKEPAERPPSYRHLSKLLLPYGSASPTPAPLGLRMLALIIDVIIVRYAGATLPFLVLTQWRQQMFASALEWGAFGGAHLLLGCLLWRLGSRLVRLPWQDGGRFARHPNRGQPLGMGRSLARAFLCWLFVVPVLLTGIALWPSELGMTVFN
jgi:hypothetical protein